jgi:uncharacterized protein (DUF2235 family)
MARNIVVLSDGTGNSAAKLARTNVWRTYQALESADDQLAIYDNGVGTSTFKPLAALGGAFGWGLKRNVLHLYKFLCRNYRDGDRIHGFGFSRGAFTIRVLMGLVMNQGLVRWHSEEELDYLAACAYRHYRAERYRAGFSLSAIGRVIRDAWIALRDRAYGAEPYASKWNRQVESIAFLGLWDTVDAYGMPIRELKLGIHKFLWPLYFDNLRLNSKVARACHALALDDERATFHPLVWDESAEPQDERKRIHQVWFAGVHSNVGGGYPDDSLSYVPLLWILEHAEKAELRFKKEIVAEYRRDANPYGRIYDSRGGISSYYRYAPRRAGSYPHTTIHPSVYERMKNGSDQYVPISVPAPAGRTAEEERVWDTVWWRRVAYWMMVLFTGVLVFLAWKERRVPGIDEFAHDGVGMLVDVMAPFVPGFLEGWLTNLRRSPTLVALSLLGIAAAYLWGRFLEARIRDRSARIWGVGQVENPRRSLRQGQRRWQAWTSVLLGAAVLSALVALIPGGGERPALLLAAGVLAAAALLCWARNFFMERALRRGTERQAEPRGPGLALADKLRHSPVAQRAWHLLSDRAIPFGFALLLLFAGVHALNRLGFMALNVAGQVCESEREPTRLIVNEQRRTIFATSKGCHATGVYIEQGAAYEVQVYMLPPWKDGDIPVDTLAGFSSSDADAPWYMAAFVPMRRYLDEQWFKPIAHVGEHSLSDHVLAGRGQLRDRTRSGELFVFVNDAVIGLPRAWNYFYRNNSGEATVVIRKIREPREGR